MTLPQEIARLVETFDRNIESYRQGRYNEAQVRREFIDPFFTTLGWDVDNEHGWAEAYKDVIHEDAIRIERSVSAPDYCFRIGGTRKFFLEAKKPSINIKDDPSPGGPAPHGSLPQGQQPAPLGRVPHRGPNRENDRLVGPRDRLLPRLLSAKRESERMTASMGHALGRTQR